MSDPAAPERRRRAALAGHREDPDQARLLLGDRSPSVRATALAALARLGQLRVGDLVDALGDSDPGVRRRAAQVAGAGAGTDWGAAAVERLVELLADADDVAEMAAWALGELEARSAVPALSGMARSHHDPLCREAAVAALGAIGDPRGLAAVLDALGDRPAVRRRAVIALAPFEGPEVEAAIGRALEDRDWQVRQAAEDLSG